MSNPSLTRQVSVLGVVTELREGLDLLARSAPTLLLVDEMNFATGFRLLAEALPIRMRETKLVLFADHLTDAQLELAINGSVSGLVSHRDSVDELITALLRAYDGAMPISLAIGDRIARHARTGKLQAIRRSNLGHFSDRQLEVLVHLAEGKRVREIADLTNLTEKAVESHKYRLMNRLGIHDRVELCRWAIREGLIGA
ncbi:MAG: response regulator transcription factor [Planctomycetaceae bacterium]